MQGGRSQQLLRIDEKGTRGFRLQTRVRSFQINQSVGLLNTAQYVVIVIMTSCAYWYHCWSTCVSQDLNHAYENCIEGQKAQREGVSPRANAMSEYPLRGLYVVA